MIRASIEWQQGCIFTKSRYALLRPNVLIDVTSVWGLQQQAMQAFESQERKLLPYASFITALNHFRALTLYPAVEYAEGFWDAHIFRLACKGSVDDRRRDRLLMRGVTVIPQDVPLVSVIVRTMGRSTLVKALTSVALQTYSHLEIVLVDAAGGAGELTGSGSRVPSRVGSTGNN